jgi:hypothetical protein
VTRAPETLLEARRLLLTHLDINPGRTVGADLDPAEVGIVGDSAHRGGYHCGSDRVLTNDYSVVESSRDRNGLSDYACALDVGLFEVRAGGRTHNLRTFSSWLVGQCMNNAADARDIREVIYSTDGQSVRRWDRLRRRSGGDSSHTWHTHISYHRDAIKAGQAQTPLFRRYLTEIGLIRAAQPAPPSEDDMPTADEIAEAVWGRQYYDSAAAPDASGNRPVISTATALFRTRADASVTRSEVAAVRPALAQALALLQAGGGSAEVVRILAGVDERLARLGADVRDAVADLGEGGAAQVRGPQG